ncbi:hypothetical protein M422DRAFT_161829 [Sphaerobolus stellatus SS14]|nr:hypothetical protein M422DRAFT_161829 [Sphaerobolus stellatus SS14]
MESLTIEGIQLASTTTSQIYKAIIKQKVLTPRKEATINLEYIKDAIENATDMRPTSERIWLSLRHKFFAKPIREFYWKTMVGAYYLGEFWLHTQNQKESTICTECNEIESMKHILTEFRAEIWRCPLTLWETTGEVWPEPSYGIILGCNLINFKDKDGNPNKSLKCLYTIIVTEAAFLIWKIQCEWRIAQEGCTGKEHTSQEIANRWRKALTQCIHADILLTDKKHLKRNAMPPETVKQTWKSILGDTDLARLRPSDINEFLVGTDSGCLPGRCWNPTLPE